MYYTESKDAVLYPSSTELGTVSATNSSNSPTIPSPDWLGLSWEPETRAVIGEEFPCLGGNQGKKKYMERIL